MHPTGVHTYIYQGTIFIVGPWYSIHSIYVHLDREYIVTRVVKFEVYNEQGGYVHQNKQKADMSSILIMNAMIEPWFLAFIIVQNTSLLLFPLHILVVQDTSSSCIGIWKFSRKRICKKRTTPGIPTWSPTVVLTGPDDAWLRWADGKRYCHHGMVVPDTNCYPPISHRCIQYSKYTLLLHLFFFIRCRCYNFAHNNQQRDENTYIHTYTHSYPAQYWYLDEVHSQVRILIYLHGLSKMCKN